MKEIYQTIKEDVHLLPGESIVDGVFYPRKKGDYSELDEVRYYLRKIYSCIGNKPWITKYSKMLAVVFISDINQVRTCERGCQGIASIEVNDQEKKEWL